MTAAVRPTAATTSSGPVATSRPHDTASTVGW
jgi:hypothetical protein